MKNPFLSRPTLHCAVNSWRFFFWTLGKSKWKLMVRLYIDKSLYVNKLFHGNMEFLRFTRIISCPNLWICIFYYVDHKIMVQLWKGIVANQKKCKITIVTALIILHFVCNSIIFDWEVIKSKKFLYTKKRKGGI